MAPNPTGFRGVNPHNRTCWKARARTEGKNLLNGTAHPTPEEAAHHADILFYFLYGDDADFNLPERMTPALKAQLDGYADVHAVGE